MRARWKIGDKLAITLTMEDGKLVITLTMEDGKDSLNAWKDGTGERRAGLVGVGCAHGSLQWTVSGHHHSRHGWAECAQHRMRTHIRVHAACIQTGI